MVWAPVTYLYLCFMVWVLSRDRNEGTNGFFDCGKDMVATNAALGVNEVWWMLLCRVIHPLGVQRLWVRALFSGALLDYAWVQKNLPSTGKTLGGMWYRADRQGVVRVWQRSTQSGSPWVGDLLLVVDSEAKVGFSSKIVQGVRLALDVQPSLLQIVVAFASVLSRNRSDAEVLMGVMDLIGVLAEVTGLHLRRWDGQAVSKAAARVQDKLTSKMRAALAAAAAQSGVLSVSLAHLRLLPSLDEGRSCPLSSSTVMILGLAVETEILSRVATELARQQEARVFKHVDNLAFAGANKGVLQMFRDCFDVCDALSKGFNVAGRQTAAGRYALFVIRGPAKEEDFVRASGFCEKWQMEVVECLTGRVRVGVDAVMLRCPPAWRSVAKGSGTGVRCLAGLWVGDLWSSKHVSYSDVLLRFAGSEGNVGTRPTGDGGCWRTEVGTLVSGRCLGLGSSSCWETKGYLMKARPYVWLDPKGGMIARAVCPGLSMFPASFVVDCCTECRVGDIVCWVVASQQQQQQQQQRPQYYRNELQYWSRVESSRTVC